jgi:PAS domain-containing protein
MDLKTIWAMIHLDDLPRVKADIARLEETGQAQAEYRQHTKAGDCRWLSRRMSLHRDQSGKPLYRDGSIRDATERRTQEEALRESELRLLQAIRVAGFGTFEHNHLTDSLASSLWLPTSVKNITPTQGRVFRLKPGRPGHPGSIDQCLKQKPPPDFLRRGLCILKQIRTCKPRWQRPETRSCVQDRQ